MGHYAVLRSPEDEDRPLEDALPLCPLQQHVLWEHGARVLAKMTPYLRLCKHRTEPRVHDLVRDRPLAHPTPVNGKRLKGRSRSGWKAALTHHRPQREVGVGAHRPAMSAKRQGQNHAAVVRTQVGDHVVPQRPVHRQPVQEYDDRAAPPVSSYLIVPADSSTSGMAHLPCLLIPPDRSNPRPLRMPSLQGATLLFQDAGAWLILHDGSYTAEHWVQKISEQVS